jgi:tRNA threonylcarbamoyladenosine biosynthesis protein TsaB
MLIAVETSTDYGSIAIGRGADITGEVVIGARTRHAESLLPAVEFLLRSARLSRNEVHGIVVGAGPGSFTGVRVAAATALGLAAGLAVPIYAFSSLACLAIETAAPGRICTVFDARRGEVYAACYERVADRDRLDTIFPPAVMRVDELRVRTAGMDVTYAGDGARPYADGLGIAPPPPAFPRAAGLLRLAASDPDGGLVADTSGWEPMYLRSSGAERGIAG